MTAGVAMSATGVGAMIGGVMIVGAVGGAMIGAAAGCGDDVDAYMNPNYFEITVPQRPIVNTGIKQLRI